MPTAKRREIDFLNILLCLIVIFIHICSGTLSAMVKETWEYRVLFSLWRASAFVVQGFIFLSGLKMALKYKERSLKYLSFLWSRVKTIIIPYIIWVIIYYQFFASRRFIENDLTGFFRYLYTGDLVSHFYFVIAIMQFYLLLPLLLYVVKRYSSLVILPLSLIITVICGQFLPDILNIAFGVEFAYNDRLFTTYLFYFIFGCYAGLRYDDFLDVINKHKAVILTMLAVAILLDIPLSLRANIEAAYAPYLENIHVLYCMTVIPAALLLSLRLTRVVPNIKLISLISGAGYYIYLSHNYVIFWLGEYFYRFNITKIGDVFFIKLALVYILPITLCTLYLAVKLKLRKRLISIRNL